MSVDRIIFVVELWSMRTVGIWVSQDIVQRVLDVCASSASPFAFLDASFGTEPFCRGLFGPRILTDTGYHTFAPSAQST